MFDDLGWVRIFVTSLTEFRATTLAATREDNSHHREPFLLREELQSHWLQ